MLIIGILFFIGYGVALNADHLPLNLISDIFKNSQNNNSESLKNNLTENKKVNQLKSNSNLGGDNKQNTKTEKSTSQNNGNLNSNQNSDNRKISSSEAKSIANKYIEEPGTSSGSPKIVDIGGEETYIVPVESNGDNVGEIYINPETGENEGGAGGAP